jgi:hypothetical protein
LPPGSGIEVVHEIALLVTWSRGTADRVDFYWSPDDALEATGLRE